MTTIWLACVALAWSPSSGQVAGYHVEVGGVLQEDAPTAEVVACIDDLYTETTVRVQGFDANGNVGPWSEPLILNRSLDFDANRDGVVSVLDFGYFISSFGLCQRASGVVATCQ